MSPSAGPLGNVRHSTYNRVGWSDVSSANFDLLPVKRATNPASASPRTLPCPLLRARLGRIECWTGRLRRLTWLLLGGLAGAYALDGLAIPGGAAVIVVGCIELALGSRATARHADRFYRQIVGVD